jgi:hypothetical protein
MNTVPTLASLVIYVIGNGGQKTTHFGTSMDSGKCSGNCSNSAYVGVCQLVGLKAIADVGSKNADRLAPEAGSEISGGPERNPMYAQLTRACEHSRQMRDRGELRGGARLSRRARGEVL